jgi:glutamate racemase
MSLKTTKMKGTRRLIFPLILLALICSSSAENPLPDREDVLSDFFHKEEVTIVVTDSGLGGLSILAEAVERTRDWGGFRKAHFIFFNALFSNQGGYNSLKSLQEKVSIFESALTSLEKNCKPDLILIGCNTLSSIFEDTAFSQQSKIPVVGIIDAGVELIARNLKTHPESKIILFATQTTVRQSPHKDRLVGKGFLPERILCQACPDLVDHIERDYEGDETEMLIFAYVDEALQKIGPRRDPLFVGLNCTHYGYSIDLWRKAFTDLGVTPLAFLNPNSEMIDFLFPVKFRNRYERTDTFARVVSMVEIEQEKIASIGTCLNTFSPETAQALTNYELRENLFEWKRYTKDRRKSSSMASDE